ncbi:MAG: hypothetical protein HZY76_13305 [Anaerolineae bacterium]|nr:MAG: hypothetical protein HZY76_13305 [Anaerolineae bacterium]
MTAKNVPDPLIAGELAAGRAVTCTFAEGPWPCYHRFQRPRRNVPGTAQEASRWATCSRAMPGDV